MERDEEAKTFARTLTPSNGDNKTTLRTAAHGTRFALRLALRMEKINNMTKHEMIEHPVVAFDTRCAVLGVVVACATDEYTTI